MLVIHSRLFLVSVPLPASGPVLREVDSRFWRPLHTRGCPRVATGGQAGGTNNCQPHCFTSSREQLGYHGIYGRVVVGQKHSGAGGQRLRSVG